MKTESEQWKLPVFIGSLVIVALLINTFFFKKAAARREAKEQEQHHKAATAAAKEGVERVDKEKEEAKLASEKAARDTQARTEAAHQKAIQEAADEHARFLARYLNSGFSRKPGAAAIAIAVASEQGTANYEIATALARRFQTTNVQMLTSFFKPEFVTDRFVTGAFAGETAVFEKLELTNSLQGVLFGRETVAYSTNPALENTITANMRLEMMALPVGTTRESQSWEFSANGVGFNQHEARKLAEERLIERMAKDTNMVLAPHLQQQR